MPAISADFAGMTVTRVPQAVPAELVRDALRMIHLDVRRRGLKAGELDRWYRAACPFPHLRQTPEILSIATSVLDRLQVPATEVGVLCEPQFIFHFPDAGMAPDDVPWPHVDEPPPWSEGRPLIRIVGVAFTEWTADNGTLHIWRDSQPTPVVLEPGDLVVMTPETEHTGGYNRSGMIRAGVYLRWLANDA